MGYLYDGKWKFGADVRVLQHKYADDGTSHWMLHYFAFGFRSCSLSPWVKYDEKGRRAGFFIRTTGW